jgi:hypothetical protein
MRRLTLFFLTQFIILSTLKAQPIRYVNSFQDSALNAQWMNGNTIVNDKDSSTNFFSRTDAQHPYSSGLELVLPENVHRKNFRLSIKGLVRVSVTGAKNQLVVSIAENDSAVFWSGFQIPDTSGKPGKWNVFEFTKLFPRNLSPACKIKIFVWNADGLSVTDIDDLQITFTEFPLTSFLPK